MPSRLSPTRWDLLGVVCVLGFAGAITGKFTTATVVPPTPTAQGAVSGGITLGESWMGLEFRGERVGYMHVVQQPWGDGARYAFDTRFQLMAQAGMHVTVSADLDAQMAVERFDFRVDAGASDFRGEAQVTADAIELTIVSAGNTRKQSIPITTTPPILRDTLGPALSRLSLEPGTRHQLNVFDPLSQTQQPLDVEIVGPDEVIVLGAVVPCIHVRHTLRGVTLNAWMTARGEMLRQELGLGLTAVRETEEEARWGYVQARAGRTTADLRTATSISVPGLGDLSQAPALRLGVTGLPPNADISDRRQTLADGVLTIRRETVGQGSPLVTALAPAETNFAAALAAEALIQSDHPRIRKAARDAIGDAQDTVLAARRLMDFVHGHVRDSVVVGVPSALEVLDSKVGDCNEHAVLFAALGRAVGMPTQIVAGLVYQEGRFAWHAWNEVATASGWLSVDATWAQFPADVGHLRLVSGGTGAQQELLKFMGRLQLRSL